MLHQPLSAYQGKNYCAEEIISRALDPMAAFLRVESLNSMEEVVDVTANLLSEGKEVAWFQGRSECGPRALGMRSLLADPRNVSMIKHLNNVKCREAFRPFAPSVLAEDVHDWFDGLTSACDSPFMSLTVPVRPSKRDQVPAICHIDDTARLQVVREADNPWYYRLIQAFSRLTGVPLCLNTSFNIRGEPIVESPEGAVLSFLSAGDGVARLILGKNVIRRRKFPADDDDEGVQPFDPALVIAKKVEGILLEEVLSDSETGAARRVRIAKGTNEGVPHWIELESELDLLLLGLIDGLTPISDVIESVLEIGEEFTEEEVMDAFRRLFRQLLIHF